MAKSPAGSVFESPYVVVDLHVSALRVRADAISRGRYSRSTGALRDTGRIVHKRPEVMAQVFFESPQSVGLFHRFGSFAYAS
jgi:hypothetical protein